MSNDGLVQLLVDQVTQVQAEQPGLDLALEHTGRMIVKGTVGFCINHDGSTYRDAYQIEISIPLDYPDSVPAVRETGNVIPADFHKLASGSLCLAAPVEVRRVFAIDRTLSHFISRLVVPYLFSYTYSLKHGELPHGDLSHGLCGLVEYYRDFFGTNAVTMMKLLKLLADGFAPPLMPCPCSSGQSLQDCHGPRLDELRPHLPASHFENELREIIKVAHAAGIRLPDKEVMPERMWKNRQKRRRKALNRHR